MTQPLCRPQPILTDSEKKLAVLLFNIEKCGDGFSEGQMTSPLLRQLTFNLCRNPENLLLFMEALNAATERLTEFEDDDPDELDANMLDRVMNAASAVGEHGPEFVSRPRPSTKRIMDGVADPNGSDTSPVKAVITEDDKKLMARLKVFDRTIKTGDQLMGSYWLHRKTQHVYKLMSFGNHSDNIGPQVIYQRCFKVEDGVWDIIGDQHIWVRSTDEFFDGRFQFLGEGAKHD